jgi:hypothetical protein
MLLEVLGQLKCNDLVGNRKHDLRARSIVPGSINFFTEFRFFSWIAQSVQQLATGWTAGFDSQ